MKRLKDFFGKDFLSENLVIRAFTHSSYANENSTPNNERLEFLGDAVLELCMSNFLYNTLNVNEGEMTKKRAQAVCEEALVKYANTLNLPKYLFLGKGEEQSDGRGRNAIIADAFEALLGAIFLLKGYEGATLFFEKIIVPEINEMMNIKDYKSTLQEYVQSFKKTLNYILQNESGPSHNKTFTVIVSMDSVILGKGTGKSKKEAEQLAAKEALERMVKGGKEVI